MELGRFTTHLIATKGIQIECFQEGLRQQIYIQVACLQIQNFQRLVKVAFIAQQDYGSVVGSLIGQKRWSFAREVSSLRSPKKFVLRTGARPQGSTGMGGRTPICGRCNKSRESDYRQDGTHCFKCGQSSGRLEPPLPAPTQWLSDPNPWAKSQFLVLLHRAPPPYTVKSPSSTLCYIKSATLYPF